MNSLFGFSSDNITLYKTSPEEEKKQSANLSFGWAAKFTEEEAKAHFVLRDYLLSLEVKKGVIGPQDLDRISDFTVNYQEFVAWYTPPGASEKEYIPVEVENNPAASKALNFLKKAADKAYAPVSEHLSNAKYSSKSKGNLNGEKILQRSSDILKDQLSKASFEDQTKDLLPETLKNLQHPAARQRLAKRHATVEYLIKKLTFRLNTKIKRREEELKIISPQAATNEDMLKQERILNRELAHLKGLKEQLEGLDTYALLMALALHPGPGFTNKIYTEMAQNLENKVLNDIYEKTQEVRPSRIFFWQKQKLPPNEQEKAYAKDVAAMLHFDRGSYVGFCKKNNITPKKEGIEDLILREVIRAEKGNYDAKGLKDSIFFSDAPGGVQNEFEEMLDEVAKLTKYAISNPTVELKGSGDPKKLKDELTDDLKEYRKATKWDLKLIDLPEEEPDMGKSLLANPIAQGVLGGSIVLGAVEGFMNLPIVGETKYATAWNVGSYPFQLIGYGGSRGMQAFTVMNASQKVYEQVTKTNLFLSGVAALSAYYFGIPKPVTDLGASIVQNPGKSAAIFSLALQLKNGINKWVRPFEEDKYDEEKRRKLDYYRVAAVGTASIATMMAAYYFGPSIMETGAAQAVTNTVSPYIEQAWNSPMTWMIIPGVFNGIVKNQTGITGKILSLGKVPVNMMRDVAQTAQTTNMYKKVGEYLHVPTDPFEIYNNVRKWMKIA